MKKAVSRSVHKQVKKLVHKPVKKAIKKPTGKVVTPVVVKKAILPKVASQPVSARMRAYNLTRDIPEENYFILANGQRVRNVAELAAILDQLEDHVFNHHVTPDKNDFHNWISDVFEDVELARKVSGVKDKKHMQLVIYRHIAGHD
jgi:hypothetical protein